MTRPSPLPFVFKFLIGLWLACLLCAAVSFLSGCKSSPSASHVTKLRQVTGAAKIGVDQVSQMPTLQIGRVYTEWVSVPVTFLILTNANGTTTASYYNPEVVESYEANGKNSWFGNLSGTSTLAVGTNSVQTILGGQHLPINTGTGTLMPANPVKP